MKREALHRSYDPDMNYDPGMKLGLQGNASVPMYAAKDSTERAKFDIQITDTSDPAAAFSGNIELFNPAFSCTNVLNTNIANDGNRPAFAADGSLVFDDGTGQISVSSNTPDFGNYRAIFETLKHQAFRCDLIRLKVADADQFDQAFTLKARNMYGKTVTNNVAPSDYINPDQNQNLIVDIPINLIFDAYTSLVFNVPSTSRLPINISFFVTEVAFGVSAQILTGDRFQ